MHIEKTIKKLSRGEKTVIVALGDSLTQGYRVNRGYVDFLHQRLEKKYPQSSITLFNKGIPGDTAAGGLNRLQKDVLSRQPDLVLIQFGLNDAYLGVSLKHFADTITHIAERIREAGEAEILLVTSVYIHEDPSVNELMEAYYREIVRCGEMLQLPVVEIHRYWKQKIDEGIPSANLVQDDGVHPTVDGYQLMAEAIWTLFE